MNNTENKKVHLTLVGLDGNAFSILGAFKKQATLEKWDKYDISRVITEAMSGDYYHLLNTISKHCVDADEFNDY